MALTQVSRGLLSTSIDDNGNATAITIDASENVLVGTTQNNPTSSGVNVAGQEFSTTGGVRSTVASNPAATFNRKTDDGSVVLFRKDGTSVGAAATWDGDFAIGQENVAFKFNDGSNEILPWSVASNLNRDNAFNLGSSSSRFKDLHLSGAINGGQLSHVVINTLLDDSVYVLDPPNSIGIVMLAGRNDNYDYIHGIVSYRTSGNTYATQMGAGNPNVLISEFSGVPGVSDVSNGFFSVVVSNNGNIYFWNRLGLAVSVSITLLGA